VLSIVVGFLILIILGILGSYFYFGPNGPIIIVDYVLNKINFDQKSNYVEIDGSGVPYVNYGFVGGKFIGKQYNPVTVSQKILEYYDEFKATGNEKEKEFLINNANWLIDNAVLKGNYSLLYYNFPWTIYDLPSPWRSGMAQGQGIQALVKAHEITNDKKYLDNAKLLLNSFFIEVKDGGVTYKSENEGWWYEEYAHEKGKESRVLNGMMYTILGIYDFHTYTNDPDAKFLFDKGIESLKKNLPSYDLDGYSYYDILGYRAPERYHNVHVELLEKLYEITEQSIFLDYHIKWKNY